MQSFSMAKNWWQFLILAVLSYLLGCVNIARLIARKKHKDITQMGSGNPGTMNMSREFGWKVGLCTFIFDAIKGGKVVKTVTRTPMNEMHLEFDVSSYVLTEKSSYDVASIRVRAVDENGNLLSFSSEPLRIRVRGPLEIIGPDMTSLRGGSAGFYLRTTGEKGTAKVTISCPQTKDIKLDFEIK